MHDNAPGHTVQVVQNALEELSIHRGDGLATPFSWLESNRKSILPNEGNDL